MHLILFISLLVCTSKNQLIRNYCHNFAFLVLYRFQGSVPIRRSAARGSLCILSSSQRKVNSLLKLFCVFSDVFGNVERCSQNFRPILRVISRSFGRTLPKTFAPSAPCFGARTKSGIDKFIYVRYNKHICSRTNVPLRLARMTIFSRKGGRV